jgi:hypothetical protein
VKINLLRLHSNFVIDRRPVKILLYHVYTGCSAVVCQTVGWSYLSHCFYKTLYQHTRGGIQIFRTDAVKIIKLTIKPIGRHHPRSSSLPHVDTGPTVSSIFRTLPGSPFLSQCQALSAIRPGSPQWYQTDLSALPLLSLKAFVACKKRETYLPASKPFVHA